MLAEVSPKLATACECTQLQIVESDIPVAQIRGENASHAPGIWGLSDNH